MVDKNKFVRAVRPKEDNIWQVGPGYYTANFRNLLFLLGYLMGNNIVFMCGMNSILMWNPYGVWKQLFYPH